MRSFTFINKHMTQTFIVVTLQVEGIHRWPAAAEILPEVRYLSDPHRHIFQIKCTKAVTHDDRDVEIIMFKREVLDYFKRNKWNSELQLVDFRSMSCEQIAKDLQEVYDLYSCEVLEDGENGAMVIENPFK
jgi:hypothetical protein